ncbi:hypothetical protein LP085_21145 [Achromobacter sp. MY14]|uniref:hypothetical protein n=1 Tax=unclassified Achromobacter TaxID=2626865 RepID=UPI001E61EF1D|nr:hypothetical protein [Achromobacter sp. MY14]MCD0499380.1 hypothetical protein [Achromobacter sp. MY14]
MTAAVMPSLITERRHAADAIYLLVDPLADCAPEQPLSLASLTAAFGADALTTVARPDLAHTPSACPVLIRLADPGQEPAAAFILQISQHALADVVLRRRYICGLLLSPFDADALADHVAARCMEFSGSAVGGMSPWFEPLRLELLAASMSRESLGRQLWPIRTWMLPTSWGSFAIVNGAPGGPADASSAQADILPTLARQTQHDAPLIATLLAAWRRSLQQPLAYAPRRWQGKTPLPPQAAAQAFRMIRQAREIGLTDNRDIIVLALHQEAIHPRLLRYEPLRQALIHASPGGAAAVLAAYGDMAWQRIAHHLNLAETPS